MTAPELPHRVGVANPELVVTTLLQHALGAARHALAAAHPEIGAQPDLDEHDADCHLARVIAIYISRLDELLGEYRRLTEALRYVHDQDLPF